MTEQAVESDVMAWNKVCSPVTGPGTTAEVCRNVALCWAEGQGELG